MIILLITSWSTSIVVGTIMYLGKNMQSIGLRKVIGFLLLLPLIIVLGLILFSHSYPPGSFSDSIVCTTEGGGSCHSTQLYNCHDCIGQGIFAAIIGLPLFAIGLYLLIPHGEGNRLVSALKFLSKLLAVLAILLAFFMLFEVYGGDFLANTFGISL